MDADLLYRTTDGNPFFVTEVLASASDGIPDTVRDAVLARVGRLATGPRAAVEAAAIVPGRADVSFLAELSGTDPQDIDMCVEVGMLLADGPRSVGFRHELARAAVEDESTVAPECAPRPRRTLARAR